MSFWRNNFKMKCYIKKYLQKTLACFCIQVQDFNISVIQNLFKRKIKAVAPFLPRNIKLHSP